MAQWEWQLSKNRLRREKIAREREAERTQREAEKRAQERQAIRELEDLPADDSTVAHSKEGAVQNEGGGISSRDADTRSRPTTAATRRSRPTTATTTRETPTATPQLNPLQRTPQLQPSLESTPLLQPMEPSVQQPDSPIGDTNASAERVSSKRVLSTKLKKSFKMGRGDTLDMSQASFLTEYDEDETSEPHGFRLQDPALKGTRTMQVPSLALASYVSTT